MSSKSPWKYKVRQLAKGLSNPSNVSFSLWYPRGTHELDTRHAVGAFLISVTRISLVGYGMESRDIIQFLFYFEKGSFKIFVCSAFTQDVKQS